MYMLTYYLYIKYTTGSHDYVVLVNGQRSSLNSPPRHRIQLEHLTEYRATFTADDSRTKRYRLPVYNDSNGEETFLPRRGSFDGTVEVKG